MGYHDTQQVIAKRILTGEVLDRDVPLAESQVTRELTGPGGVTGSITPDLFSLLADDGRPLLEEWSTALYVVQDGELRGGGIVTKIDYDKPTQNVEAIGFCGYPRGIPYADNYFPPDFPDPIDVIRHLVSYVQTFPDSNIGLSVDSDAATWMVLKSSSGVFRINDYDDVDCGDLIDQIAQTVPLDYLEQLTWADETQTAVNHTMKVGFPRLGRKRRDLAFVQGENVTDFAAIGANGEIYSNDIYVRGEGSGYAMLRSRATVRDGRLRRPAVIQLKSGTTQGYVDKKAQEYIRKRQLLLDIAEVTVKDHPNARLAALQPGDDILVEVEVPWLGDVRMWVRVLSITFSGSATSTAVLKTMRSEVFDYASSVSPTGEKVPVEV